MSDTDPAWLQPEISQETARELLEAAKEALIVLRELRWQNGDTALGDRQIAMLVDAVTKAEGGF